MCVCKIDVCVSRSNAVPWFTCWCLCESGDGVHFFLFAYSDGHLIYLPIFLLVLREKETKSSGKIFNVRIIASDAWSIAYWTGWVWVLWYSVAMCVCIYSFHWILIEINMHSICDSATADCIRARYSELSESVCGGSFTSLLRKSSISTWSEFVYVFD